MNESEANEIALLIDRISNAVSPGEMDYCNELKKTIKSKLLKIVRKDHNEAQELLEKFEQLTGKKLMRG